MQQVTRLQHELSSHETRPAQASSRSQGLSLVHGVPHPPLGGPKTIYIRTTPGRAILNQLIYENLFL